MKVFDTHSYIKLMQSLRERKSKGPGMVPNSTMCFVCGTREKLKSGICTSCKEEFPVVKSISKSRTGKFNN